MSDAALRQEIWSEWHKLPDSELSPVKTIATKLGVPTSTVAAVVFPAETFGAWSDDQEPTNTESEVVPISVAPLPDRVVVVMYDEGPRSTSPQTQGPLVGLDICLRHSQDHSQFTWLTADEADRIADLLREAADKVRREDTQQQRED
jgi:hypothetical protein